MVVLDQAFNVCISQAVTGDPVCKLQLSQDACVSHVKNAIAASRGIVPLQQQLLLSTTVLPNGFKLADAVKECSEENVNVELQLLVMAHTHALAGNWGGEMSDRCNYTHKLELREDGTCCGQLLSDAGIDGACFGGIDCHFFSRGKWSLTEHTICFDWNTPGETPFPTHTHEAYLTDQGILWCGTILSNGQ
mmetsp:Transcript_42500/g.74570  ORF Transcript_42500/g.74570 Transcript_42500/m.74570 type:complete len:191 (-) Transcript_42500:103-675(-)